jgi:hypothetical protein
MDSVDHQRVKIIHLHVDVGYASHKIAFHDPHMPMSVTMWRKADLPAIPDHAIHQFELSSDWFLADLIWYLDPRKPEVLARAEDDVSVEPHVVRANCLVFVVHWVENVTGVVWQSMPGIWLPIWHGKHIASDFQRVELKLHGAMRKQLVAYQFQLHLALEALHDWIKCAHTENAFSTIFDLDILDEILGIHTLACYSKGQVNLCAKSDTVHQ